MWTLTCKHKLWGKNWLYLRPYLKAFPFFNVLETRRVYLSTIDLGIFQFIKKFKCKHKTGAENWSYLRPYLKAFRVFNVLQTCRVYLLTIDLGIVKFIKKLIERFFGKCEICRRGPNYVQKL